MIGTFFVLFTLRISAHVSHRERQTWRCIHCLVHGAAVWAVRDGPNGPRVRAQVLIIKLLLMMAVFMQQLWPGI